MIQCLSLYQCISMIINDYQCISTHFDMIYDMSFLNEYHTIFRIQLSLCIYLQPTISSGKPPPTISLPSPPKLLWRSSWTLFQLPSPVVFLDLASTPFFDGQGGLKADAIWCPTSTCVVTVPLMATCTRRAYRLPQVLCGWNASDFPNLPNIQVLLGQ